jgi:hypothetical protein
MTTKLVDAVARHAVRDGAGKTTNQRVLSVTQGRGKDAKTVVLSTPIVKIDWGTSFRALGGATPMEQYTFQVDRRQVERFADAAALVLRKHHVQVADGAEVPTYLQEAIARLRGEKPIKFTDGNGPGAPVVREDTFKEPEAPMAMTEAAPATV